MRLAYLISLNNKSKSGLYYSIISKIKYFEKNNPDINIVIYNMAVKQPYLVRKSLKFIGLSKNKSHSRFVVFDGLTCQNLFFEYSLLTYLRMKLNWNFDFFKEFAIKKSKEFENVDLINAHYTGPVLTAYYLNKYYNIPYVSTFHGSDINFTPFESNKSLNLYRKILIRSFANIFVSKTLLKKAEEIYFDSNNFVLYNGIDRSKFFKVPSEGLKELRLTLDLEEKVIGFVGNFVDVKNVLMLPDIFNEIKKINNKVSFIVIGDGILREQLEFKFKELDINISYLGRVDRSEIVYYYNLMNVLVLPSKNEGLPLVLLEAMACEVKCIGAYVGGIPEVIGNDNCYVLDREFIKNISQRAITLLKTKNITIDNISKFDLDKVAIKERGIYELFKQSN